MPALGSAEHASDIYAERLSQRMLAYEGVTQKDKPVAQAHLSEARVRLRALRGLLADTVGQLDVDVLSGHVAFDYDTSRELAGAPHQRLRSAFGSI